MGVLLWGMDVSSLLIWALGPQAAPLCIVPRLYSRSARLTHLLHNSRAANPFGSTTYIRTSTYCGQGFSTPTNRSPVVNYCISDNHNR